MLRTTELTTHTPNDYALNFTSHVWGSQGAISPLFQTNSSIEITYRFAKNTMLFPNYPEYDCSGEFGSFTQALQRQIFNKLSAILPENISFKEIDPFTKARINFGLCNNLPDSGLSELPGASGSVDTVIQNKYFFSIETDLRLAHLFGFDVFNKLKDAIENVLLHETGHAMGLLHTQKEGEQGNALLSSSYTSRSSVMSYLSSPCSSTGTVEQFAPFSEILAWSPIKAPTRTDFGKVDILNLQYAYNISAPSILPNQTDDTFACPKKEIISIFVIPTTIISWPAQVALGATFAATSLGASAIGHIAKQRGWSKLSKFAYFINEAFITFTPPEPSPGASWRTAIPRAALDVLVGVPRVALPFSALVFDITYSAGCALKKEDACFAFLNLGMTAGIRGLQYVLSRAVGVFPFYAIYTGFFMPRIFRTQEAEPTATGCCDCRGYCNCCAEPRSCGSITKNLVVGMAKITANIIISPVRLACYMVVNTRGIQHLLAGSRISNWANCRTSHRPAMNPNAVAPLLTSSPSTFFKQEQCGDVSSNDKKDTKLEVSRSSSRSR